MNMDRIAFAVAFSSLLLAGAQASPITYNVDFSLPALYPDYSPYNGTLAVTGTITTDGALGTLAKKDITSVSLKVGLGSLVFPNGNAAIAVDGAGLVASGKYLKFSFDTGNSDFEVIKSGFATETFLHLNSNLQYRNRSPVTYATISLRDYNATSYIQSLKYFDSTDVFTLGTAAVSSVPLPASAPMFGAALLTVGAVGYSLKRSKTVSTA